jgi:hypothetical protein
MSNTNRGIITSQNPNNIETYSGERDACLSRETQKRQVAEKLWFHYFNQELFKRGVISELERNKMAVKIETRNPH